MFKYAKSEFIFCGLLQYTYKTWTMLVFLPWLTTALHSASITVPLKYF